jgi:hypothetical protein
MLARNFKTPAELELTYAQHAALIKVLDALERGELIEMTGDGPGRFEDIDQGFSMRAWSSCICGWADRLGGDPFKRGTVPNGRVSGLFSRTYLTMSQATIALRDFLVHGEL